MIIKTNSKDVHLITKDLTKYMLFKSDVKQFVKIQLNIFQNQKRCSFLFWFLVFFSKVRQNFVGAFVSFPIFG